MIPELRSLRFGGVSLLVVLCLQSCKTTVPELLDSQGALLSRQEPAIYRLAVAPFELPPGDQAALRVGGGRRTAVEMQGDLVTALVGMQAVSEVLPVDSADAFVAYEANADLLLQPRLQEARFSRDGVTGRAFVSGLLWLTTWFGSLWVEDSRYRANLVVDYDLVDPHTGRVLARDQSARSEQADLSFWDRNEAFSSGFFLSLLVPPFLVGDNRQQLGNSLAQRANSLVAAQCKNFILDELPARQGDAIARVALLSPTNGGHTTQPIELVWEVSAHGRLTEAAVLLNNELYHTWDEEALQTLTSADSADDKSVVHKARLKLPSVDMPRPGRNIVRFLVNIDGLWTSRSVLVHNDVDAPPDDPAQLTMPALGRKAPAAILVQGSVDGALEKGGAHAAD